MKQRIYDIALFSFPILLRLISPFHKKAKLMIEGRLNWEKDLLDFTTAGKRIWIHCASLGEFEQGRPLIELIKRQYPKNKIVVTFFSSSGFEVMKSYKDADYIGYLPFDSKKNAQRFIEVLKPSIAIFIKYEFWHHYLSELKKKGIPVFSVSALFRKEQQFFKKNGGFSRRMLFCFNHFFVQNNVSAQLLKKLGFDNVTISGDTRFDRVKEICSNPERNEIAEIFKGNEKVLVIGSSWPADMDVLLPFINDLDNPIKVIIAPHEIGVDKINKLVKGINVNYQLYSNPNRKKLVNAKVLIVDNIGLLSSLYQYGDIAYVGGSFGDGLHNILEAATFGLPLIFGKAKGNNKYQEAIDLLKLGGAFEVSNAQELGIILKRLILDETYHNKVSKLSSGYVTDNVGATETIINSLNKYLD